MQNQISQQIMSHENFLSVELALAQTSPHSDKSLTLNKWPCSFYFFYFCLYLDFYNKRHALTDLFIHLFCVCCVPGWLCGWLQYKLVGGNKWVGAAEPLVSGRDFQEKLIWAVNQDAWPDSSIPHASCPNRWWVKNLKMWNVVGERVAHLLKVKSHFGFQDFSKKERWETKTERKKSDCMRSLWVTAETICILTVYSTINYFGCQILNSFKRASKGWFCCWEKGDSDHLNQNCMKMVLTNLYENGDFQRSVALNFGSTFTATTASVVTLNFLKQLSVGHLASPLYKTRPVVYSLTMAMLIYWC